MRLFVALDVDGNIRERIARFVDNLRELAPDTRWVRPQSLHVTLKFIGEKSEDEAVRITRALETIPAESPQLSFRGYGFFPSARAPRVFWIGTDGGTQLTSLAATVDEALAKLGIPKEEHSFNPHLTLARGGRGSGSPHRQESDHVNLSFQVLQEKLAASPDPEFGTMTAREFFLYQSQSAPGGSKYTRLARFALR